MKFFDGKITTAFVTSMVSMLVLSAAASAQFNQFDQVVKNLESTGIFEFFLPFILIFAVVYGMLQKTKIFGDPKDDKGVSKINGIVAFAFAAFIMIFPTTSNAVFELTDFLANVVGGALIYIFGIIVAMLIFFMIATPLSGGETPKIGKAATIGGVMAFVLVIALFFSSGGTEIFPGIDTNFTLPVLSFGFVNPTIIALLIVLVIMGLAIYWITK